MAVKRPPTQEEIRAAKKKQQVDFEVGVVNISKQLIKVHLRPPAGLGFFDGAQDVNLNPGQSVVLKKKRLWMEQIDRLCKQGKLSKISDSEKLAEQIADAQQGK